MVVILYRNLDLEQAMSQDLLQKSLLMQIDLMTCYASRFDTILASDGQTGEQTASDSKLICAIP